MDASALPSARAVNRPGCISAYAILLWLGGAFYILSALCLGVAGLIDTSNLARYVGEVGDSSVMIALLVGAVCLGLLGVVPIVTGVGLWQMKDWAWWLVVVLQSLGLALTAVSLCTSLVGLGVSSGGQSTSETTTVVSDLIGVLVAAAINGGILYWFLKNHDLFRGGAGAQPGQKAATGTVVAIVLAVVGIFVLVPIVVIVILALLGPAIANVFSNIMVNI